MFFEGEHSNFVWAQQLNIKKYSVMVGLGTTNALEISIIQININL